MAVMIPTMPYFVVTSWLPCAHNANTVLKPIQISTPRRSSTGASPHESNQRKTHVVAGIARRG